MINWHKYLTWATILWRTTKDLNNSNMKINSTVNFPDGSRLFILGSVLPKELYTDAVALFNSYPDQTEDWVELTAFVHCKGRLVYSGLSNLPAKIQALANSTKMQTQLTDLLGFSIKCSGVSLWLDLPGYQIRPHYDTPGFEYSIQIYAPDEAHYFGISGTCVYTEPTNPMFELTYMPNSGYCMDRTQTILHGMNHHVPGGYTRNSIYLRFKKPYWQPWNM